MQQSGQLIGFVDERFGGGLADQIIDAEHQQAPFNAGQTLQILRFLDQVTSNLPPGSSVLGRVQGDRLLLVLGVLFHGVQTHTEIPDCDQFRVEIVNERHRRIVLGGQAQREELIATGDHNVIMLAVLVNCQLVFLVARPSVGAEHVLIGLHAERLSMHRGGWRLNWSLLIDCTIADRIVHRRSTISRSEFVQVDQNLVVVLIAVLLRRI